MPEIKAFKSFYYNLEKVKDFAKVVCPPYDVISPSQQDNYYKESPYNFIRVLLGKDKPTDDARENRYTRSQQTFDQWLKEGILVQDDKPAIYYYLQEYKIMGQKHSRLGFISLMKIEDDASSKIFPHENTHTKAKEDRMRLLTLLSTNLCSIFVCFSDKEKKVQNIFIKHVVNTKPFMDVKDDDGVRHVLWRLEAPDLVKEVAQSLSNQLLFIADGHHRYEVAKEYRQLRLSKVERPNGTEPFQYLMTYFTDIDSKDLKIFPMHRIVKHLPKSMDFLEEYFRIDKIKQKQELMILLAKAGQNEHAFGVYTKEGMKLLRLKNKLLIDKYITEGSRAYRHLDAMILKNFVFDRLGVLSEDIVYTKDLQQAASAVDEGLAEASFIMNPVAIQQLKEIALNGERMPPKTTYFYPKVLSGLTVYKME